MDDPNVTNRRDLAVGTDIGIVRPNTSVLANSGVFLVRNTPWSREFFRNFVDTCTTLFSSAPDFPRGTGEQDCLNRLLRFDPQARAKFRYVWADFWNCRPNFYKYFRQCDPFVYHALGPYKGDLQKVAQKALDLDRGLLPDELYHLENTSNPSNPFEPEWELDPAADSTGLNSGASLGALPKRKSA
jgi:hypothetical protein